MKKLFLIFIAVCCQTILFAQDVKTVIETARTFMHKGDYPNAILVLNRGLLAHPSDLEIAKNLALNYYYSKDYKKALEVLDPVLDRNDVDDQCFQIAGDSYWGLD